MLNSLFQKSKLKQGQALYEMFPAFILFFILISGSIAYFKFSRNNIISQEVARNLLFAKINNSGPLVSSVTGQDILVAPGDGGAALSVLSGAKNGAISDNVNCFSVIPGQNEIAENVQIFGQPIQINEKTSLVIHRTPSGNCQR